MSDETSQGGAGRVPSPLDRKPRGRRGPTPAELVLLRWLAAKPRPVTMGPIGNCVKRGWCEPVRAIVEDDDGRRLGFIYVVTEAGARLIGQQAAERSVDDGHPAASASSADGEEARGPEIETSRRPKAVGPER